MKITLRCRPELLRQWQDDVEKNPTAFAKLIGLSPEFAVALVHDAAAAAQLHALVNTPHTADFLEAVRLEAAHQALHYGEEDRNKLPEDWCHLVLSLVAKCLCAAIAGDRERALHHTISSAAALLHWHAAIAGVGEDKVGQEIGDDCSVLPATNDERLLPRALMFAAVLPFSAIVFHSALATLMAGVPL